MKVLERSSGKQSTDAERVLWRYLRAHRTAGYRFRRRVVIGSCSVDFICLEAGLIVEAADGHPPEQVEDERMRSVFLESLGYKVIRFRDHEILNDIHAVLEQVHSCLIASASPRASPGGRGDRT